MLTSINTNISYVNNDIIRNNNQAENKKTSNIDSKNEDVKTSKADQIAQQIADGTYKINIKETAKALMKEMYYE